jgi:hypothetical protein
MSRLLSKRLATNLDGTSESLSGVRFILSNLNASLPTTVSAILRLGESSSQFGSFHSSQASLAPPLNPSPELLEALAYTLKLSTSSYIGKFLFNRPIFASEVGARSIIDKAALRAKIALLTPEEKLHFGFTHHMGLPESAIRFFVINDGVFATSYFACVDEFRGRVSIVFRGSVSTADVITDIVARPVPYFAARPLDDDFDVATAGPALTTTHQGMYFAALRCYSTLKLPLAELVKRNPSFRLIFTGHSLGAGVAALLGDMLKPTYPKLELWLHACPAVFQPDYAESLDWVTTTVNGPDPVPRLSFASIIEVAQAATAQLDPGEADLPHMSTQSSWLVTPPLAARIADRDAASEFAPTSALGTGAATVVPHGIPVPASDFDPETVTTAGDLDNSAQTSGRNSFVGSNPEASDAESDTSLFSTLGSTLSSVKNNFATLAAQLIGPMPIVGSIFDDPLQPQPQPQSHSISVAPSNPEDDSPRDRGALTPPRMTAAERADARLHRAYASMPINVEMLLPPGRLILIDPVGILRCGSRHSVKHLILNSTIFSFHRVSAYEDALLPICSQGGAELPGTNLPIVRQLLATMADAKRRKTAAAAAAAVPAGNPTSPEQSSSLEG